MIRHAKLRITKKGRSLGGHPFDKATLWILLTNPIYIGTIRYKDEHHDGAHEAIIEPAVFEEVQKKLKQNGHTGSAEVRNKYGALLRGLLRCKACGTAMTHTFCGNGKRRFYRYYRCVNAIKNGHGTCPTGTLPAGEIERVVVDEVRGLGKDEPLMAQVLSEAHAAIEKHLVAARRERDDLCRERKRHERELQHLVAGGMNSAKATAHAATLHDRLAEADRRLPELDARIAELGSQTVTPDEARAVFADFDGLWERLIPREQGRLLQLLLTTVAYDGEAGTVAVTFRPTSIRSLINRRLGEAA